MNTKCVTQKGDISVYTDSPRIKQNWYNVNRSKYKYQDKKDTLK